jgi:hypothetical protein
VYSHKNCDTLRDVPSLKVYKTEELNNKFHLKGLVSQMKLSSHALRALQELDEIGREAVEQIVRAHIRACRLNGFQPENLERVYQEAIEIIRLEGPPKKDPALSANKYEPTRRYEQYRSPRAL